MWKVYRRRGYIGIRGEDVYAVVDPERIPEDVIDLDFIILTKKVKNRKLLDDILERSKATLVGSTKNVKKFTDKHYVTEITKITGLTSGLWVAPLGGSLIIGIDSEDGYALLIQDKSQVEEAEDLGMRIYGKKGRVIDLNELREEEV